MQSRTVAAFRRIQSASAVPIPIHHIDVLSLLCQKRRHLSITGIRSIRLRPRRKRRQRLRGSLSKDDGNSVGDACHGVTPLS